MTLLELSGLVGLLLPLLISLLKRAGWATKTKQWFALGMAVAAAVVTEGAQGADLWNFTPMGVFASLGVILPASQAIYAMILKDSAVDEALTSLPL